MSAFPSRPPHALDDPDEIRENDWRAFRGVQQMHDHWRRPGWTTGRRSYHWLLTAPSDAEDVRRIAAACQAGIAGPDLDPVPLDALHVTVGRIGFTDEVTIETAAAVAAEAVKECADLGPIELLVGPLAGSRGAVRFSLSPWHPLIAIHQRLTTATWRVLRGQSVMNTDRFRPHLSIAYANSTFPTSSLIASVDRLRTVPPVTMTLDSVALVELRREERTYRYLKLHEIRLGTAAKSRDHRR